MAFEGMQPTFKHVPPNDPRFSTQAVYRTSFSFYINAIDGKDTNSESELSCLDGTDVAPRT